MFFFFVKFLLSLQEQNQSQLIQKKKKKKPLEISLADQEMLVEYIFNFSKWLQNYFTFIMSLCRQAVEPGC